MATANQRKEDHLTCIICAELYTHPITLTCGHTFCRKCVTEYTKTKPDAVKDKSVPCAYCRRSTRVPNPAAPVDEWAAQFNLNIVILGLLDDLPSMSKKTDDKFSCNFCSEVGETTLSTLWCEDCEISLCDRCAKIHRIGPATCEHNLVKSSVLSNRPRKVKPRCTEHTHKYITSYCVDCQKPACQTCLVLFHRACKTVVSFVPHMVSELERTKQILSERLLKTTHRSDTISTNNRLQRKKTSLRRQVASARQKAVIQIDGEVAGLLAGIDSIVREEIDLLKKNIESEASKLELSRKICDNIDSALNFKSTEDLYTVFQTCQTFWKSDTRKTAGQKMSDFKFVLDSDMLGKFRLGEIVRIPPEASEAAAAIPPSSQPVSQDQTSSCAPRGRLNAALPKQLIHPLFLEGQETAISAKVASEDMEPNINDITVLLVSGYQVFIIADVSTNAVTCIYRRNKVIRHSKIQLEDSPWKLASKSEDQVMALIPRSKQIVTIVARPELKSVASITTAKVYWCLAVSGTSALVVGGGQYKTACVDILDTSGHLLRTILVRDEPLVSLPEFLCVDRNGRILVLDKGQGSLICVTSQDEVMWTYTPTGRRAAFLAPQGITTTPAGEVLLVDKAKMSITKLTESGNFVQDFPTEQQPKSIACDHHGSIYVAYETCIKSVQC